MAVLYNYTYMYRHVVEPPPHVGRTGYCNHIVCLTKCPANFATSNELLADFNFYKDQNLLVYIYYIYKPITIFVTHGYRFLISRRLLVTKKIHGNTAHLVVIAVETLIEIKCN